MTQEQFDTQEAAAMALINEIVERGIDWTVHIPTSDELRRHNLTSYDGLEVDAESIRVNIVDTANEYGLVTL